MKPIAGAILHPDSPTAVACPVCKAAAGWPCGGTARPVPGKPIVFHVARELALTEAQIYSAVAGNLAAEVSP